MQKLNLRLDLLIMVTKNLTTQTIPVYKDCYIDLLKLEQARVQKIYKILCAHANSILPDGIEEGFRRDGVWTFHWIGEIIEPIVITQEQLNEIAQKMALRHRLNSKTKIEVPKPITFNSVKAFNYIAENVQAYWGEFIKAGNNSRFANGRAIYLYWFEQVGFYAQKSDLGIKKPFYFECMSNYLRFNRHKLDIATYGGSYIEQTILIDSQEKIETVIKLLINDIGDYLKYYAQEANRRLTWDKNFQSNLQICSEYYPQHSALFQ